MRRTLLVTVVLGALAASSSAFAVCDGNGDGNADIVTHRFWVIPYTGAVPVNLGADDETETWGTHGNLVNPEQSATYGTYSGWHPRAVDDFYGTGACAALWIHDDTGAAAFREGSRALSPPTTAPEAMPNHVTYRIVGAGDLVPSHPGREVLAFNEQTRQLLAIDAAFTVITLEDRPGALENPVAVGDMNGDGVSDLLFESLPGGNISTWLMAEAAPGEAIRRVKVEAMSPPRPVASNWRLAAVGPFDDQGVDDVLWLNTDPDSHRTVMWFMGYGNAGPYRTSGGYTVPDSMQNAPMSPSPDSPDHPIDWVIVGPR